MVGYLVQTVVDQLVPLLSIRVKRHMKQLVQVFAHRPSCTEALLPLFASQQLPSMCSFFLFRLKLRLLPNSFPTLHPV